MSVAPALRWFLPLLLIAACGDGSQSRSSTDSNAQAEPGLSPDQTDQADRLLPPDPSQRPAAPARVFDPSRSPQGAWFDALAKRFSPGPDGDDWPTEVVGPFAERRLRKLMRAALARGPLLAKGELSDAWEGSTALVPASLKVLRDDGYLRARVGEEFAKDDPGGRILERLAAHLSQLVEPVESRDPHVYVQVVACNQTDRTRFETVALIRIGGPKGEGAVQINLRLQLIWKVGRGVQLAGWTSEAYELVEIRQRPFAELTRQVLPQAALSDEGLWSAGIEHVGRHDRGIPSTNVYLGMHGMGIGDLDGDGLEDVVVGRQGGRPNLVLKHLPDGSVRNVATEAGLDILDDTGGVLLCDLDGDYAKDVVLGIGAAVVIFWNDGSGAFPERTQLDLEGGSQVYSLTAADADGDGDLDLYDTRYFGSNRAGGAPAPYHDARNGASNAFWRQTAVRTFVAATAEVGLDHNNDRFSLAALWEDLDGDGDLDLYVTNDFGRNNLYINEGGQFRDVAEERGAMDMAAGMGISVADVDLDGDLDLYVSNMHSPAGERVIANPRFQEGNPIEVRAAYQDHARGNSLLLGDGAGGFRRARSAKGMGTGPGGWAWGSVFCDYDGDGLSDILVPNGFATGRIGVDLASYFWRVVVSASPPSGLTTPAYLEAWRAISHLSQVEGLSWNGHEPNYAYWNIGDGQFVDASVITGLDHGDDSRVASPCDWDLDGRMDLWMKNRTAPVLRFMHGRVPDPGPWIAFELRGSAPNTEAVGGLVRLELSSGRKLSARVHAGYGYLGSPTRRLRFGLGEGEFLASVEVDWPDGRKTQHGAPKLGALHLLSPDGGAVAFSPKSEGSLSDSAEARLESRIGELVVRVPALASLPMGPLRLPTWSGPPKRVDSFKGRPLMVMLWGSWDDASLAQAKALAESGLVTGSAAPLALWPISLDKARHESYAQAALAATGLTQLGGRADRRTRKLFEAFTGEIVGGFDDLPLPLAHLYDRSGQLVCVYFGAPSMQTLAADVAALKAEQPCANPLSLSGGYWVLRPVTRALKANSAWLRREGEVELAEVLERTLAERGQ
ncbi:MAG: hypothetical protein ACI8QC_000067 [Planctomycetota bacterium]|jgi:hypothetical protein